MSNGDDRDFPAFLFYWRDWLTGAPALMTAEQCGMYINLLANAWGQKPPCTLPDDDNDLAALARVDLDTWMTTGQKVRAQFVKYGRRLRNQKLYNVYRELVERSERRSRAGRAGAAQKAIRRSQISLLDDGKEQATDESSKRRSFDDLMTPIVYGVLWLSTTPPNEEWTLSDEIGIAKRLLKGGDVALDELVEAARCIRTVGNLPPTEPVSLRIFAGKSARARGFFQQCVGAARKRISIRPKKVGEL